MKVQARNGIATYSPTVTTTRAKGDDSSRRLPHRATRSTEAGATASAGGSSARRARGRLLLYGLVGLGRVADAQSAVNAVAHEAARAAVLATTAREAVARV